MISKCLNPACRVDFSHERGGRIVSVDRHWVLHCPKPDADRGVEQYWLCGPCSQVLKVVVENGSVAAVPIDMECSTLAG
ncbi:MAG TPA: hypothetical protein VMI10_12630 [Terriglobales bacterium]|nr:hypothetical protein [Terriglobales bacterium]